jgi:serine/threonine protein kinase
MNAGFRLGHFEITERIGAGGMGEVYKARDTRLDRTVAVKELPPHVAADRQSRERFEREARAVAALNHPHICTLHDIGSQDGIDFLVMEYVEGETLAVRLEKGPLPLDVALQYAIEIASGLDRAHRAGIVHRDIKPGNIMLTKAGTKLLDFGLAKASAPAVAGVLTTQQRVPDLTEMGLILGTVQYMAPEQIEGGTIEAEKAGATVTVLERKARARANDIALTLSGALRLCRVLSGLVLERLR